MMQRYTIEIINDTRFCSQSLREDDWAIAPFAARDDHLLALSLLYSSTQRSYTKLLFI